MSDPFGQIPPGQRPTPAESLADMTGTRDDAADDAGQASPPDPAQAIETANLSETDEADPDTQAPPELTEAASASLGTDRRRVPAWKRAIHLLVIVAGFGGMGAAIYFLTRDTWEDDHLRQLASMKSDAENAMAACDFDKACDRFDALQKLVGNHDITTPSGHDLVTDAAAERVVAQDSQAIVHLRSRALDAESRHDWKGAAAAYRELLARGHDMDHPPRAVVQVLADSATSLKALSGNEYLAAGPATKPTTTPAEDGR